MANSRQLMGVGHGGVQATGNPSSREAGGRPHRDIKGEQRGGMSSQPTAKADHVRHGHRMGIGSQWGWGGTQGVMLETLSGAGMQ
jgi:hypothetical protein